MANVVTPDRSSESRGGHVRQQGVLAEVSQPALSSDDLPRVRGDAGQLRQLFQIDDALTHAGDDPPRITAFTEKRNAKLAVSARDRGIGIEPTDRERILDRLHTCEEYDGAGIGLCRRTVKRHGGDVAVDSTSSEGSTVTVPLPTPPDNK